MNIDLLLIRKLYRNAGMLELIKKNLLQLISVGILLVLAYNQHPHLAENLEKLMDCSFRRASCLLKQADEKGNV